MMGESIAYSGIMLVFLAGICSGTFSIPFKANREWKWENNWLIWTFVALVICPWIAGYVTVPNISSVLSSNYETVLLVAFFGLIWGIGAVLFGKGIDYLGVSLALPIMQGLINSVGTLLPILMNDASKLFEPRGIKLMIGVLIILVGIVLYAVAGSVKNQSQKTITKVSRFKVGLIICIFAGILGPMINFAFVYGEPLTRTAISLGASELYSTNAIWCIVLSSGFVVNLIQSIYFLVVNKSWGAFSQGKSTSFIWASLAGVVWYLSIMFYGMGCSQMGAFAASIGWALMQSMSIIAGNVAGIITGEWKGAPRKSVYYMFGGLALLILGVIVIAA